MEKQARAESVLASKTSGRIALEHAIKAAELYMRAAEQELDTVEAARLRQKCHEQISCAEKLKARVHSPLIETTSGALEILSQGSKLHECEFPPWNHDPPSTEFERNPDNSPEFRCVHHSCILEPSIEDSAAYRKNIADTRSWILWQRDETVFTLSSAQIEHFAAWVRPVELFKTSPNSCPQSNEELMMRTSDDSDLVQDITTDCSVVASLSAAYNVLVGKHAVSKRAIPKFTKVSPADVEQALSSIFYPFDYAEGRPRLSASGKYIMKLNFNGCARRVTIDDRLPSSRTGRAFFVVDRHNPCLLWPALLEKAYLKVRGGYDFPGSNSGTDLWVLIGWIPEQIFLQKDDVDIDELWNRIEAAYQSQDVIITMGTGRITTDEEQFMGLVGEHDYAVEAMDSTGGVKRLLVKNPWCEGPTMATIGESVPSQSFLSSSPRNTTTDPDWLKQEGSGNRLWLSIEDVVQHFAFMYLNWNPSLFTHRRDHHFSWTIPRDVYKTSLSQNPQFSVTEPKGGTMWIVIHRHFIDAELEIARSDQDSTAGAAHRLGYMSISVFENNGLKVHTRDRELYSGPYVDSPLTLARLDTEPGQFYTIVIDQQELPLPQYSFTMSLFANSPPSVSEAREAMSCISEHDGAWTRRTAGGHSSCATFLNNPQYSLSVTRGGPVSILLSADSNTIHVHVDVVWAKGERVAVLRVKDVVASSGEYRRGCAEVNIPVLEPGVYTVVCSTFDAGQLADFVLRVASMTPVRVAPVPADEAGRFVTDLPEFLLAEGDMRLRASLHTSWLARASVTVQTANIPVVGTTRMRPSSSSMVRLSIVLGWGSEQVVLAVSGEAEFQDPSIAIRTPYFDMEPDRIQKLGLWIVMESVGCNSPRLAMKGNVLSDSQVRLGSWESA
ncbi:hypothetical protein E4U22_002064 [Claviceps purpurea]|nr:hypothetical protein E4U22_002064 [Claviceps purpurea]